MRKPTFVKVPSGMSDKDTMKAVATSIAAGLIEPLTEIVTKTEEGETSLMVTKFRTFKVSKDEDGSEMRAMECKTTILGGKESSEIISMVELHCESIPESKVTDDVVEPDGDVDGSEYDKMMRNLDKELVN